MGEPTNTPRDRFHRPLESLRVSVTDRCDLRCGYCMPEADYAWLPRHALLTFEETTRIVGLFLDCGVRRVRITGGEPLLRRDLPDLVRRIAELPGLSDLALTTNGVRLSQFAPALHDAGLPRVTVSLDTLRRDRFAALTRRDALDSVLEGIRAARRAQLRLKLNTVLIAGVNDDEVAELLRFAADHDAELRFIEYMDVGGATRWSAEQVVSRRQILERVAAAFGAPEPQPGRAAAPAERFRLSSGQTFGVIASTTEPFCRDCDRARLTADGVWLTCLYAFDGVSLRDPMRSGASDEDLRSAIRHTWRMRSDRGAELRAATPHRGIFVPAETLRRTVHAEMHTRGG